MDESFLVKSAGDALDLPVLVAGDFGDLLVGHRLAHRPPNADEADDLWAKTRLDRQVRLHVT